LKCQEEPQKNTACQTIGMGGEGDWWVLSSLDGPDVRFSRRIMHQRNRKREVLSRATRKDPDSEKEVVSEILEASPKGTRVGETRGRDSGKETTIRLLSRHQQKSKSSQSRVKATVPQRSALLASESQMRQNPSVRHT
jgi:ABC-type uncharacterized transport system ATPase subunit